MKLAPAVALLVLAVASPAPAQDETIGVRWREWKAKIDGHLQGQGDILPASDIDVDDTLGFDKAESGHEIQLVLNIPYFGRFYGGYWWIDFDGEETLTQTITFADRVFTVGTTIDSTLDLDMYYLTYELPLPGIPLGREDIYLEIGLQAGVRALLADASIRSPLFDADDSGGTGIPVLGLHGTLQVTPFVRAEVEIVGLAVSYGRSSLRYVEAFGEIVGQFGPAFAGVGYKQASLDLSDERGDVDFDVDVDLGGFYLTAGLRF